MTLEIIQCEQNTPEWFEARTGLITCSEFNQLLAKGQGKTRRSLLLKKAAERITGNTETEYENQHMIRGKEQEAIARELYIEQTGIAITKCGFMKNGNVGYSPDGLINDDGLIEIKSRLAYIQADILLNDKVPSENMAQIQGGLWISGRKYLDYISYCPGMPLFIKRVFPDADFISNLQIEINKFEEELQKMTNIIINKF